MVQYKLTSQILKVVWAYECVYELILISAVPIPSGLEWVAVLSEGLGY